MTSTIRLARSQPRIGADASVQIGAYALGVCACEGRRFDLRRTPEPHPAVSAGQRCAFAGHLQYPQKMSAQPCHKGCNLSRRYIEPQPFPSETAPPPLIAARQLHAATASGALSHNASASTVNHFFQVFGCFITAFFFCFQTEVVVQFMTPIIG